MLREETALMHCNVPRPTWQRDPRLLLFADHQVQLSQQTMLKESNEDQSRVSSRVDSEIWCRAHLDLGQKR